MNEIQEKLARDGIARWKEEERRSLWSRILRWGFGIPLMLSYPWLGRISPFLVLLGCILIAPDIAAYFGRLGGRLLWPHYQGRAQPLYSIPESLAAKGQYAEAEQEYEKIIQAYPDEVKPHADMITIAVRWLNDGALAEALYRRGMSLLRKQAARDKLTELYAAIRTRLKSGDEASKMVIPHEELEIIRERLTRDRHKLWR